MKKIGYGLIIVVIVFMFSGCNKQLEINEIQKSPTNITSLSIVNSNQFDSRVRRALSKNGFKVKLSSSLQKRKIYTASGETSYNEASTRYGLLHHGIERTNGRCLITNAIAFEDYTFELVDFQTGDTILELSIGGWVGTCHSPEQSYILETLAKTLQEKINPNKVSKNNIKQLDKTIGLKIINKEDITKKEHKVYFKGDNSILNGRYKVLSKKYPKLYSIVIFTKGLAKSKKIYTLNHRLQSEIIFHNGIATKEKKFNKDQSLFAIINIKDDKFNGLAKYFYSTGELNYEINYTNGIAINGYKYQLTGNKSKMTEAHFYNLKIPYNN
mgnify:FL=1|jgi:antitoxin component YwqK of YwqJK toxin-antitoxin module